MPDGVLISTPTSHLLPVRWRGAPAMLKVAVTDDERLGGALMAWWAGDGAAPVLACEDHALLMERAEGGRSLARMSRTGGDDEACAVLCAVAARLHAPRPSPPSGLIPLAERFRPLNSAASAHGGVLVRCAELAAAALADQAEPAVLHGDLHQDNVLDFGLRSWLAIDPKGLWGERAFDFANIFTNPDLSDPEPAVAIVRETFERRLDIVTKRAALERPRLLRWIVAWAGLSAAWMLEDGASPFISLRVAELGIAALYG